MKKRGFLEFLRWKLGFYSVDDPPLTRPPNFVYPFKPPVFDRHRPGAMWIGHSTFLVKSNGLTILTDPVFAEYCSPIPIKRLKRRSEIPCRVHTLPKIDIVLLSHNHYDHLDEKAVLELKHKQPKILWILPKGMSSWFHRRGITRTLELGWWSTLSLNDCSITAVPAQHFSGRSLWDRDRTHWNGYVVETGGKKLYFVGDTGYNEVEFKKIGVRFAPIDLSLIPIGAYLPRKLLASIHCSPDEAVLIHQEVGSRFSVGMHWNTFCLSEEPQDLPPYELYLAMKKKKLSFDTFVPIDMGTWINW